jgi:hypothetical protein
LWPFLFGQIAHRAGQQAKLEGAPAITPEHLEKVLPQLLLDFS